MEAAGYRVRCSIKCFDLRLELPATNAITGPRWEHPEESMKQQKQSNRLLGDEAFPARLPYPTVPTNLSGVFATAPLPAAFDPKTASDRELLRHGLLWPRPKAGEDGVVG